MRKRKLSVIVAITATFASVLSFAQATGSISGVITDEKQLPLAGVTVQYNRMIDFYRDSQGHRWPKGPYVNASTQTDSQGRFALLGLPGGDYYVCAVGTRGWIGSCEWNQPAPPIHLIDSGTASVTGVVRSGSIIKFRVTDRSGNLAGGAKLLIGVMSANGYYRRAELLSVTGPDRLYAVTVPKQTEVRLFLNTDLSIVDGSGRPVRANQPDLQLVTSQQSELLVDLLAN